MREFNWLGGCTSCNTNCCHNENKFIPENECSRPEIKELGLGYEGKHDMIKKSGMQLEVKSRIRELPDYRPLECRLFPFDVKEIDDKLVWVMYNNCHATPKLNYEKFIDFFEKKFSREIPLDYIKRYVTYHNSNNSKKLSTHKYIVLKEVNWPTINSDKDVSVSEKSF